MKSYTYFLHLLYLAILQEAFSDNPLGEVHSEEFSVQVQACDAVMSNFHIFLVSVMQKKYI